TSSGYAVAVEGLSRLVVDPRAPRAKVLGALLAGRSLVISATLPPPMMRRESFRNAAEKPWARIAVLAVALILVAVLLYRQVQRFRGDLEVWVAASDLAPGAEVVKTNLKSIRVRESEVPGTVLREKSAIEGKRLARAKRAGTPFFRADFAPPDQGPGLAGILPEGRVLVFLPLASLPLAELVEQ